jgi:hypothetical protein
LQRAVALVGKFGWVALVGEFGGAVALVGEFGGRVALMEEFGGRVALVEELGVGGDWRWWESWGEGVRLIVEAFVVKVEMEDLPAKKALLRWAALLCSLAATAAFAGGS